MLRKFKKISKSARFYLWPAVAGNAIIVSLGVGAELIDALLLGSALCCLASFGFLLNDLFDRRVDKANSAKRLEYADSSTLRGVWLAASLFLLAGLGCAASVSLNCFGVCLWISLGLTLYSAVIRPVLLAATLLSALLGTAPLWAPLILWHVRVLSPPVLTLFAGIYVMFVAREIILDIKDEKGDRVVGRHTFPTIYGGKTAGLLACFAKLAAGGVLIKAGFNLATTLPSLEGGLLLVLLAIFLYFGVLSALQISLFSDSREEISVYVLRSRVAMAILPFLLSIIFFSN